MSSCARSRTRWGAIDAGPIAALRRLIYCGEWIESHTLHIYLLHAPDFLGYPTRSRWPATIARWLSAGCDQEGRQRPDTGVGGPRDPSGQCARRRLLPGAAREPTWNALVEPLQRAREIALATVRGVAALTSPSSSLIASSSRCDDPGRISDGPGPHRLRPRPRYRSGRVYHHVVEEHVAHSTALHRGCASAAPT